MRTLTEELSEILKSGFKKAGYDPSFGNVVLSNRPDLCEYQCNGAMAAAKQYKKAPFMISEEVVNLVSDNEAFKSVESVKPGFININLNPD
ncbi:MAG: arginine--tRNA ligase, partial [Lachnospiraceae bacterium]|nr:arginine--tRNA ligase [Lachnospiraceae bacterium]